MENNKREIQKMKIKYDLEKIYLILMFSILLWASSANLWEHKLSHDFPYGLLASDSFQHQIRTESIKDMGNYRYEAPYISAGFKDTIGFYPPVLYHLGVIFSYLSGLETYDSVYFLVFILTIFSALIVYLIIKQFNKQAAIIALPLAILTFTGAAYVGFTWGSWPAIAAQFFLIALFWSISKIDFEHSFILLGIFLSAAALTHTSEGIFAVLFIIFYLIIHFIKKELTVKRIKDVVFGGILSFVLSVYYIIIFKFTWMGVQPYKFMIETEWGTTPLFKLTDFKIVLVIFIIIGIIFSILALKKRVDMAMMMGIFMFLVGYGNFVGFNVRSFQIRLLWPIYLSVFFGLAIYQLLKFVIKKWRTVYSIIIAVIFILIFIKIVPVPFIQQYEKLSTAGLMDSFHWEALTWFPSNTEEDAKILFLYGDMYNQNALLRNIKRPPYMVKTNEYVAALNEGLIKRNYKIDLLGDHKGVNYAYRKSLFSYGYYKEEYGSDYFYNSERDICSFDYYVFDAAARQNALAQYNLLILQELLKNGWFEIVHKVNDGQWDLIIIAKNNKPGEKCMEDEVSTKNG